MSSRGLVVLIICAILFAVLVYWVDLFSNPYAIYAVEVFSGNWSAQPPAGVEAHIFVAGALIAVMLNTGQVIAVLKAVKELTIIRKESVMNIKNAFNFRDEIALQSIMRTLSPLLENLSAEETQKIEDGISRCFVEANKEWEDEFLPKMLTRHGAARFLKSVHAPSPN